MVSKIIYWAAATITPCSIPHESPNREGSFNSTYGAADVAKKETGHCGKRPVSQRRRISALNSGSNFGGTSTSCDNHFHLYKNLCSLLSNDLTPILFPLRQVRRRTGRRCRRLRTGKLIWSNDLSASSNRSNLRSSVRNSALW